MIYLAPKAQTQQSAAGSRERGARCNSVGVEVSLGSARPRSASRLPTAARGPAASSAVGSYRVSRARLENLPSREGGREGGVVRGERASIQIAVERRGEKECSITTILCLLAGEISNPQSFRGQIH